MQDWYVSSFGPDYLIVYKHRDVQGAYEEVRQLLKWLNLPAGAQVLDLCCGMGRHSLALTKLGYHVTGVDLSETLLAEAKASDPHNQVKWVQGDMREVPLQGPFDAVMNLFTSFGYFRSDDNNQKVLSEIARLLAPHGQFVIDFLNPAYIKANLVPYSERQTEDLRIYEKRSIENGFVIKHIEIEDRQYIERVKLYDDATFRKMAEQAGLKVTATYGNYDQSDFDADKSPRQIWVGTLS